MRIKVEQVLNEEPPPHWLKQRHTQKNRLKQTFENILAEFKTKLHNKKSIRLA